MTDPNSADPTLDALFENNRQWAASLVEKDADLFRKMASHQSPESFARLPGCLARYASAPLRDGWRP